MISNMAPKRHLRDLIKQSNISELIQEPLFDKGCHLLDAGMKCQEVMDFLLSIISLVKSENG